MKPSRHSSRRSRVASTPEKIRLSLREAQLRVTPARLKILKVFSEHHGPFSADQLFRKFLKEQGDLVTLYRTLTTLHESKLLRKCDFGDGVARFELGDLHSEHHHHHLICKKCQKTEVIHDAQSVSVLEKNLENMAQILSRQSGFSQIEHQLEFFGFCGACSKKSDR